MAKDSFPFGADVQTLAALQPELKKLAAKKPQLADAALLFTVPSYHTDFSNVLVWRGDTSIAGDLVLDGSQKWVRDNGICMVVCFGNLQVERDILNRDDCFWPLLAVDGDLSACNMVKGGMPLLVWGNLNLAGYMLPDCNDGPLRIGKNLRAMGYFPACKDNKDGRGHVIGGEVLARVVDCRRDQAAKELSSLLIPEALKKGWFDFGAVLACGHQGRSIFKEGSPEPEPEPEQSVDLLEIPAPDAVDPTTLGSLESPQTVLPLLLARVSEKIDYDPERYSYPESFAEHIRLHFQRHKSAQILVLADGTDIKGDLVLDWQEAFAAEHNIGAVVCDGDLTVSGDILNAMLEGGLLLFVSGNLQVDNLIAAGSTVIVLGSVLAGGLVVGVYNDGVMRIGGDLKAAAYLLLDHDGFVRGQVEAVSHSDDDGDWCEVLLPHVFDDEDDFHPNVDKLRACQKAGLPIFAPV